MKDRVKRGKIQRYICNTGICMISVFIIAALIWRIQCSISYYDEVLNIYISYITAALGQRHLVENGYIFSMGDLFNLPFVYLFWRITGGTEGLLLFIRFVYLGFNLVLAGVFWQVFGKCYGKKTMLLFGLILITFFPGGMYTVSYDTAALFFSLMGGVLLLGSEMRNNEKTGLYRYFAGVCHACMVYSYPLMAGVVLVLLIGNTIFHVRKEYVKGRTLLSYWIPYCLGGMTVLGIFLLYVLYVGGENVYFFQPGVLQGSLNGREVKEITSSVADVESNVLSGTDDVIISSELPVTENHASVSPIFSVIQRVGAHLYALLNYMWIQQRKTLIFTLIMLVQWGIGLLKKGKWRLLLIPEILLVAFSTHTNITCFGGTTMYAYCFLWAPFLFCYLDEENKRQGIPLLLVLGLTSCASFLAIGFTSIRTDKAHMGLYCGAICTFMIMIMLARKEFFVGLSLSIATIFLIAICNMGMAYIDHFQGADIKDCTYRMQKGIFKGMMTWEKDVQYENLKTCLEKIEFDEGAVICMTDYNYYAACLDGNLRATEGNFNLLYQEQMLQAGESAEDIYKKSCWPEAVLIDNSNSENYANLKMTILQDYYRIVLEEEDYCLYVKE